MDSIEDQAAAVLRALALNETAKALVLGEPALYEPLYRAALRYIGGESLDDCLAVARTIQAAGHAVTLDYMGESTRERAHAVAAAAEFVRIAGLLSGDGLQASISLDLSHVGLVVDATLCREHAAAIATAAADAGTEVMISAEGIERTDAVLDVHGRLCETHDNVGITVQAYLHRTSRDLDALLDRPGKIRIVKGAFAVPAGDALPRGAALNAVYLECVARVVGAGRACSVASHDPEVIEAVRERVDPDLLEFEMLHGIAGDRLDALRAAGERTRIYLPYGREWFLYLCNRIAEFPPSLFSAIVAAGKS